MDNQSFFRFCRVFALLCAFFLHPASGMSLTLLLATDDTPGNPWIMGGGLHFQKDLPGIEIELYRHMAGQLGLELKMVRMPWKRCLFELKAGLLDGVFPASFKPERLEIGVFPFKNGKVDQTRKSRDSAYYLYRLKSSPVTWRDGKFVNLEQMPRPTIGAPLGWSIVEDLRRMNIDVLERPRPIELLEMLSKGGLAGVACLSTVADVYIVQAPHKLGQIEKVYPPISEKTYFLMLSHQFIAAHPVIAEKIWDTIAEFKTGDVFNSISKRYTD
ncbi:extracellular solute-binding protein, family 3 [Desulfosarcina variabilis str. Montpellier]